MIPKGRVTSYGAIAKFLNAPNSSRLVGYAMNHSHSHDPNIPAHRVVNRNGMLTGKHHFENSSSMQDRLEAEGLTIVDDTVQKFDEVFWDPAKEIF